MKKFFLPVGLIALFLFSFADFSLAKPSVPESAPQEIKAKKIGEFPDLFDGDAAYLTLQSCLPEKEEDFDINECYRQFIAEVSSIGDEEELDFVSQLCAPEYYGDFFGNNEACFSSIAKAKKDNSVCDRSVTPARCTYLYLYPSWFEDITQYTNQNLEEFIEACLNLPDLDINCKYEIQFVCNNNDLPACEKMQAERPLAKKPSFKISAEIESKLEILKEKVNNSFNYIDYTALKMLQYKYGLEDDQYFYYQPAIPNLEIDLKGGFTRGNDDFFSELNLLTGGQAIDESLQLDAVGQFQSADSNTYWENIKEERRPIQLSEISPVEIKSHPWDEMIKNPDQYKSPIFKLVPEDDFVIYFEDIDYFSDMEKIIQNIAGPLESLMGLKEAANIKDKIIRRLGIPDFKVARELVDEIAFVSEDLDFTLGTDYALVVQFKSDLFIKLANSFKGEGVVQEKVGDYFVITTHERILNQIKEVYSGERAAMYDAKDFHFMLETLDQNREGFAYLSDLFIRKLTGPEYRIKADRRHQTINQLKALQYSVFGYRSIHQTWPDSLQQLATEGYLDLSEVDLDSFNLEKEGWVTHKDWGSLRKIVPLGRVELGQIKIAEKRNYETFRDFYQGFWRNFFDPIGIGFVIEDQLMLHTVILPLIDSSEYHELLPIVGGETVEFSLVQSPLRAPTLQLASKVNWHQILQDHFIYSFSDFEEGSDANEVKEVSEEVLNAEIKKALNWETEENIVAAFGDEIVFGLENIGGLEFFEFEKIDAFVGIELNNVDVFKALFNKLIGQFFSEELDDQSIRYKEVDYFSLNAVFLKVYYTFIEDNFYLAPSELTIKKLIDAIQDEENYSDAVSRGFDYTGNEHNILFHSDLEKLALWGSEFFQDYQSNYALANSLTRQVNYLNEALALAQLFEDYDGTLKSVESYYENIPSKWMEGEFQIKEGQVWMQIGDQIYNLSNDDFYKALEFFEGKNLLKFWKDLTNLNIGLSFNEESLEARVAFNNPFQSEDGKIGAVSDRLKSFSLDSKKSLFIIRGIFTILIILGLVIHKKGKANIQVAEAVPKQD